MRLLLVIGMLLVSHIAYCKAIEITCYGNGKQFFKKNVKEVYIGDGYVLAEDKANAYFLVGECVIRHPLK